MPHKFLLHLLTAASVYVAVASSASDENRLVLPALEPFEQLIGDWRAHGFLEAEKLKGWDEPTTWGWRFRKGKIVAAEVAFKGGRYFSAATLEPLETDGQYRFAATTPDDKPVMYEGTLKGKKLTLVRQGSDAVGPDQVTIELLHDVRYQMLIEAKKSPTLVRKVATIGATRADVRFGALSKEEQGPKCIITGAPGTSQVTYKAQTYYVCCSGCRSEFEHDPEKWLKLAREGKSKKDGGKLPAGDAVAVKDKAKGATGSMSSDDDATTPESENNRSKDAADKGEDKTDSESKSAAALLARAKLLEKNNKRGAAIQAYERLLKDFPKAREAKEAETRLKELRSAAESQ
jgi:hypothetical protein